MNNKNRATDVKQTPTSASTNMSMPNGATSNINTGNLNLFLEFSFNINKGNSYFNTLLMYLIVKLDFIASLL